MGNSIIRIDERDNVAVALRTLQDGEVLEMDNRKIRIASGIQAGHKVALGTIEEGEEVIKYGYAIGHATGRINEGEHVHTHNLKTGLGEILSYEYNPVRKETVEGELREQVVTFDGYLRPDGRAGIRNEVWIIPTVGCVNRTAELLRDKAKEAFAGRVDDICAWTHPLGCSQLGEDHETTQRILAGLAAHPNAGGVLVISLGCENNNLEAFMPVVRKVCPDWENRIRTLVLQESSDELKDGLRLLDELTSDASRTVRTKVPADKLVIGLKCGGSDGFSGITANPLCGQISDWITGVDGTAVLTEVPEMFGAEQILMDRAENADVFRQITELINGFKNYFIRYGQEIYENPSPGNKAGGITTLEDKSLGCIQKGGRATITGVLDMGMQAEKSGLNLLYGPGNDLVSCTALAASGAQMILFTTGRGNPYGAPVPTIKISSNSALAERKRGWIDFDAGRVLEQNIDKVRDELIRYIIDVASGNIRTKNEQTGYRQIVLFKDGVTL